MNNVVTYCALLATAAVAVTAYNFEDPEFNQILARDLEDLYETYSPYSQPRNRRDEEAVEKDEKCRPGRRWGKLCCAEDLVHKVHEADRDVKRSCFKELFAKDKPEKPEFDLFKCGKPRKHKKRNDILLRLTLKLMTVCPKLIIIDIFQLDSDGNPKEEEFSTFVKETFSAESWLTSLQDKVISTCLDEAKNATANRDASDSESCNPAGAMMAHCLFREIQLNCPAEQIKDEKSCARLQERIKGHDFFSPPPPPGAIEEPDN
ncbi:hypothetical protein NQ314_020012 [Rhamnusium bicolor]|uniref:Uncharacterized protein n=1 Tax=Rhamnusium bicolor TaxID=1586634 RepID=A0AAV8WMT9_9CUCU|nr:hypothetical protein NQ314_020012 [Rhamnusium bicolor]